MRRTVRAIGLWVMIAGATAEAHAALPAAATGVNATVLSRVPIGIALQDTGAARPPVMSVPPSMLGRQVQGRRMPRLIGMDTLAAIRLLDSLGIGPYVVRPPGRGLIPVNVIRAQRPLPDSVIFRGQRVQLGLGGLALIPVPHVVGLNSDDAAATIIRAKLVPVPFADPAPGAQWVDRVVRQAPDSSRRLFPGSRVMYWIGKDARIPMPSVVGQSRNDALRKLREAGMVEPPVVDTAPGTGDPLDSIVTQAPDPNTPVWPQDRTLLTLGRAKTLQPVAPAGPEPPPVVQQRARVPSVVGLDTATAIRRLAGARLRNYDIALPRGARPVNAVASQVPNAGRLVPLGTIVRLALRPRQADSIFVPLVVGLTVDSARAVLADAGLGTRVEALFGSSLHGRVHVDRQQPEVGAIVPAGSTVAVVPSAIPAIIVVVALVLGLGAAAATAAFPSPVITQLVRLYPARADAAVPDGPLVAASVGLRSRVAHHGARLEVTGSLLA